MALCRPQRIYCTFLYPFFCRTQPRWVSTSNSLRGSGKPGGQPGQLVQQTVQKLDKAELAKMKAKSASELPQDLGLLPRMLPLRAPGSF